MLLKKRIIIIAILLMLLFPAVSYAQVCEVGKIKQALRKALYLYFINEGGSGLTPNEVKDMLIFYLTISTQNSTVDCSALGAYSNKPLFDVISQGENLLDRIPTCTDGTKYGECSKTRPSYCYAGAIYEKCGLCGCPTNSVCGKSGKCEALSQNITCFRDIDCGQNDFIGDYYCTGSYINRNYTNYTCQNPGAVNSRCVAATSSVFLTYCNPTYSQVCAAGKNTCQTTINDSAPTASISVNPATIAQGQFFNVTVVGADDVGLAAIWWWAANSSDSELNKAHWYNCNGAKTCKNSWLVSTNATGTLSLGANSRDTVYPVAGQPHQASEGAGIAYATLTVTSGVSNATSIDMLTVKGRIIDRFSGKPLANIPLQLLKSGYLNIGTFNTNANGEFAITTSTTDITQSANKLIYYALLYGTCYLRDSGISISRYPASGSVADFPNYQANAIYVWANPFDLSKTAKYFAVTGAEVNIGDLPLWPSADISINSDTPVGFNIEYTEEGGSTGNSGYSIGGYLRAVIPLSYNVRVKVFDSAGNNYYSPYINVPLSNGCAPVKLNFFNKQVSWNISTQSNASNASNCFVKIDGIVVKSVYAVDRNDCYSKTSFGSENCKTYAPYFADGVHFLEQYFGAADRVNNEYCTCTNGICVQGNQTNFSVTLHSLAVNGSNLEAVYSKNFGTCVHLLTSTNSITHTQNYFCTQGNYIKTTAPLSGINVAAGQNYKLCHGNNYNICSELKSLANATTTNQITLESPTNLKAGFVDPQNVNKWGKSAQSVDFKYTITANTSSIRLYEKRPGQSIFSTLAEFKDLTIWSPFGCSKYTSAGSWILVLSCGSTNLWSIWRISQPGTVDYDLQPASSYTVGAYEYYVTAVDKFGTEGPPSNIGKVNFLQPLTILSPKGSSSSTPVFQWTVSSGWPSGIWSGPYFIRIAESGSTGTSLWSADWVGISSASGYTYTGPALDPAKTYVAHIFGHWEINSQTERFFSLDTATATFWIGNQTTNQTQFCSETNKLVNFENPPHLSFHLTWNPDLGTQDSYNYNQDEIARNWLRAQGIEITGTPNGIVWGTGISGPVGTTGVIIGDASPSFAENDEGISDNEVLTLRFLNNSAKSVTVTLTSTPSNVSSINNIPTTVIIDAYNSAGNLLTTTSKTFTGVTNGAYTPTTIGVSSANFDIAKITLRATQYPYGGVWLEDINFKVCT